MRNYCYQVFYTIQRGGMERPGYLWVVATGAREALDKCAGIVEKSAGQQVKRKVAVRDGCKPEKARQKLHYFYETFPQDMAGVRF